VVRLISCPRRTEPAFLPWKFRLRRLPPVVGRWRSRIESTVQSSGDRLSEHYYYASPKQRGQEGKPRLRLDPKLPTKTSGASLGYIPLSEQSSRTQQRGCRLLFLTCVSIAPRVRSGKNSRRRQTEEWLFCSIQLGGRQDHPELKIERLPRFGCAANWDKTYFSRPLNSARVQRWFLCVHPQKVLGSARWKLSTYFSGSTPSGTREEPHY